MVGSRALLGETITCPDCNQAFRPIPKNAEANEWSPADKMADKAKAFETVSIFFVFLGVVVMAFCFRSGEILSGLMSLGAFLSISLVLYLVGQVMHIRALVMRK